MHPAAGSVSYQFRRELGPSGEALYRPDLTTDKIHIVGIVTEYRQEVSGLVHLAFDPGLITLRVPTGLNFFQGYLNCESLSLCFRNSRMTPPRC
jgi:hypothetical protein